jgi:hypothetical protein
VSKQFDAGVKGGIEFPLWSVGATPIRQTYLETCPTFEPRWEVREVRLEDGESRKKHSPGGREAFAGLFPPLGILD